jgi:Zn-dependent peptidase ImmA (M78 family)
LTFGVNFVIIEIMMKKKAERFLNRLESYLLDQDIVVSYEVDAENLYCQKEGCIEINSRQDYESRLYTLLHESGHVSLRKSNFKQKFPFMKKRLHGKDGERLSTYLHRADVLREEVLAWDVAEDLAATLSIELNHSRWANQRSKCLISYMKWAVK